MRKITQALFRVLDTETTGLDPAVDRIVEIGACDVYYSEALEGPGVWLQSEAESWLCNPGIPIPPIAKAVHHIIDAHVRGAPPASVRITQLLPAVPIAESSNVFVAHNAPFDRGMLEAAGFPAGARWLDTYRLAMHVWPDAPSYKNEVLRYWLGHDRLTFGISHDRMGQQRRDGAHSAAHDAGVTALVLREAFKKLDGIAAVCVDKSVDVDQLIAWADSPVVLKGVMGFGKHHDKTWEEVAQRDLGYLEWIVRGNEADWDRDKYHTARYYTGRLL